MCGFGVESPSLDAVGVVCEGGVVRDGVRLLAVVQVVTSGVCELGLHGGETLRLAVEAYLAKRGAEMAP